MDTGVCVTCGAEEVDVNDEGKCEACGEMGKSADGDEEDE